MPDFRQIIVLVDVYSKLDFLQLRAGRPFILGRAWRYRTGTFRSR